MGFEELQIGDGLLDKAILHHVGKKGFKAPSPIQKVVIPLFCGNNDVAVEACTGSGKTLAYLIPIFHRLLSIDNDSDVHSRMLRVVSLIIAPTRELVQQISQVAQEVLNDIREYNTSLLPTCHVVELYGGRKGTADRTIITRATKKAGCHQGILVATPGRLKSQLLEGPDSSLKREKDWTFRFVEVLVIDEADKLFSTSNFQEQMRMCLSVLPKQRRTGVFSATLTSEERALTSCGMRNPLMIKLAVQEEDTTTSDDMLMGEGPSTTEFTPSTELPSQKAVFEDAETAVDTSDEEEISDNEESINMFDGEKTDGGIKKVFEPKDDDSDCEVTAHYIPIGLRNYYMFAEQDERLPLLLQVIESEEYYKILVFTATCASTDFVYTCLKEWSDRKRASLGTGLTSPFTDSPTSLGEVTPDATPLVHDAVPKNSIASPLTSTITVERLHGKLEKSQRRRAFESFRSDAKVKTEEGNIEKRVLVASDLAARGIDFQGIDLIVQLDAPNDPSQIFHRMGRTARAGGRGDTLLFISPHEDAFLHFMKAKGVDLSDSFGALQSYMPALDGSKSPLLEKARITVHEMVQSLLKQDKYLYEMAKNAFVTHLRSYMESQLGFIFSLKDLDLGRLANRFGLFKIPFTKEIKEKRDWPNFISSDFDPANLEFRSEEAAEKFRELVAKRHAKREEKRQKMKELALKRKEMLKAKRSASARKKRRKEIDIREMEELDKEVSAMKKRQRQVNQLKCRGVKVAKADMLDDDLSLADLVNKE